MRHPIIATLSKSLQAAYRKLRQNADILGRVLVYDARGEYQELVLIGYTEADDPNILGNRTVIYDPRLNRQKSLLPA